MRYPLLPVLHEWSGTYYVSIATQLAEHLSGTGVDPDHPTAPIIQTDPMASFTMTEASHDLFGLVASVAVAGAQELALIAPGGEVHQGENIGAPVGEMQALWEVPAQGGEWMIIMAGARAAALAYVELYEITEESGTF